jgi:hypothetical protein
MGLPRTADTVGGIVLQEYDATQGKLVGPITNIFQGSSLGLAEGPHLYRRDGTTCWLQKAEPVCAMQSPWRDQGR